MRSQTRILPAPGQSEALLAVGLSCDDHRALKSILASLQWKLTSVESLAEGVRQVLSRSLPVIVCEHKLPVGSWKVLLDRTSVLSPTPSLIVSSRLADEGLWAEVLNLGGYDVLATPFEAGEVRRVLSQAVDSWHWRFANMEKSG